MSTSPFTSSPSSFTSGSPSSFFAIPQPTATVPLHPLVRAVLSWCQLHHLPYLCSSFARSTAADLYALTKMDCIAFANGDVIKGTFLYNLIQGFKAGVYSLPIQVTNPNAVIPSTSPTPYSPTQDDTSSLSSHSSDPRIPSLHEHHATLPPLINMSIPATYHQDYYLHPPIHPTPNNNTSPQLSSFTPFMASNFTATTLHKSPSGLSLYDQSPNQKRKYEISSHQDSVDKQTRAILALQGIAEHTWSESEDNNTPIASPQVSSTSSSPRGRKRTKIEEDDTDDSSEDIHTKRDKPYKCDKCGRGFTVVYSLEAHYRIHTGEKPYKCQFCSRAFTQSGHLTVHERTHTGERPFKCSYCEKTFARPDLARRHERVHTGERPFKCSHCDKAFTTSGNRKVHERRIHAGDDDKE